jgi:large subunit ribosomal protein L21
MTGEKMRYAIVESGGKQYRAVEGQSIDVDRLSSEQGAQVEIERVLLMADGEEFLIGTPTVSGIDVKATVVEHFRGPKVFRFKYSPKKRIRVRGGHRQQYTRLLVDFIGHPGEERKVEKAEPAPVIVEAAPEVEEAPQEKKPAKAKKARAEQGRSEAKEPAAKKTSAKSGTTTRKSTATKSSSKKTDSKKK